jgi:hypothetical protein
MAAAVQPNVSAQDGMPLSVAKIMSTKSEAMMWPSDGAWRHRNTKLFTA